MPTNANPTMEMAIQNGIDAADRGEFIDHAVVKKKWQIPLASLADDSQESPSSPD